MSSLLGIIYILINYLIIVSRSEYVENEVNNVTIPNYEYVLPIRKVVSCPSFASFKFSCANFHIISIENLLFSPVLVDTNGECNSDWSNECKEDGASLEYLSKECAGKETCSIISYNLRSRTKCSVHQVISINYRCVPTWEVREVPAKCDICKNVTITNCVENFGFIHSSWYPKLYPRVSCNTFIQNKPEHAILIYSVAGSIGLDRIRIESYDQNNLLIKKEIISGNLTTQLILTTFNDVNITVLPDDAYFIDQRRFLLYFYMVPKCYVSLCSNVTGRPSQTTQFITFPTKLTTITSISTYAPIKGGHKKKFQAWLAAILALIYALLMILAVILAIYCRRRRRKREIKNTTLISNQSCSSTSHIFNPVSRTQSHLSLREGAAPFNYYHNSANSRFDDSSNIYSHVNKSEEFSKHRVPAVRQTSREIDNYSQLVSGAEEALHSTFNASASYIMNYGDVDIQKDSFCNESSCRTNSLIKPGSSCEFTTASLPFTLKSENHLGSILASTTEISQTRESTLKSVFKTVEYPKNIEDEMNDGRLGVNESFAQECSAQAYRIDAARAQMVNEFVARENNYTLSEETQSRTIFCADDEIEEKSDKYVFKLIPERI